ncbi:MAG: hypothetical protein U0746_20115 [Gemmataceae bacterium]
MRTVTFGILLASTIRIAAAEPTVRAGAYAMDVTPPAFPISVNGNMADRLATRATDPMHARCIVFGTPAVTVAMVTVDSCMLPRELIDSAKAQAEKLTGIPAKHILISATHTHTAPASTGVFQSDANDGYVRFLPGKIAEGIAKAKDAMTDATVGAAAADEPSQLFNRRWKLKPGTMPPNPFGTSDDLVKMNPGVGNPNLVEPAGPVDPGVTVLAFRKADGTPIALHANYSLHYVGDLPPLSADYFGVFCELIGPAIGAKPPFVAVLSNGTSGDVNNVDVRGTPTKTQPGENCRRVAAVVSAAAKRAYENVRFVRDPLVAVVEKEIELKVRKPNDAELARAKDILAKAGPGVLKGLDAIYARETVLMAKYPDTVKLKLQAIRIGDTAICAVPCEVFADIGLTLKKKSPFGTTFTISLANGYNGYLPTPEQHKLGGYETWRARSSYLEVTASETIVATMFDLLAQLRQMK